jgi:hypothetical protein
MHTNSGSDISNREQERGDQDRRREMTEKNDTDR